MALKKVYDALGQAYYVEVEELTPDAQGRVGNRQVVTVGSSNSSSPDTIGVGNKTIATVGTPDPLVASSTPCTKVWLMARPGNAGNVFWGNSSVDSDNGDILFPGQKVEIEIDDLNKVYFDVEAGNTSDGVRFTYTAVS